MRESLMELLTFPAQTAYKRKKRAFPVSALRPKMYKEAYCESERHPA